ncbi:unnamed protein product [Urochloa decumbens]
MFASARCGELPELLDARAILADKFGRDFAAAAKEGAPGVVDPTLVKRLSGERPSLEQKRRLAKEIAAENDVLLEFPPENPAEVPRQVGRTASQINNSHQREREQLRSAPNKAFVQESAVKTDRREVQQGAQKPVDGKVNPNPSLAQLSVDEKVLRESKKYFDARMAAEAAFRSASFAAMAARAAVELSRTESQGKGGPRGGGGYDKAPPPVQTTAAAPSSWRPHKSPSPSPSWSDRSTATSVGSDKGKEVMFDQSDGELEDVVAEDVVWPPPPQRRPSYRRAASTVGTGAGAGARPFQNGDPENNNRPPHRRIATEFEGGNAHALGGGQRGQYVAPPYRRVPAASTGRSSDAGAYESSAYAQPAPYARIVSALERGNEHIARHEEVRRMGTDARVLQERVYGAAAPGQGHGPLNPERRANSVRTRR